MAEFKRVSEYLNKSQYVNEIGAVDGNSLMKENQDE